MTETTQLKIPGAANKRPGQKRPTENKEESQKVSWRDYIEASEKKSMRTISRQYKSSEWVEEDTGEQVWET